jgi:hypothetical protein
MGIGELLIGLSLLTDAVPAGAGSADVVAVKVTSTGWNYTGSMSGCAMLHRMGTLIR